MIAAADGFHLIPIVSATYLYGSLEAVLDKLVEHSHLGTTLVIQTGSARPEIRVFLGADCEKLSRLGSDRAELRKAIKRAPVAGKLRSADSHDMQRQLKRMTGNRVIAIMSDGSVTGILVATTGVAQTPRPTPRPAPRPVESIVFGGGALPELIDGAFPAEFGGGEPTPPPRRRRRGAAAAEPESPPRRRRSRARAAEPAEAAVEAEAEPAAAEPDTVERRTPHLDAPANMPKTSGSKVTVTVYLDGEPMAELEDGRDVVVTAPASVPEIPLTVDLVVSDHFRHLGDERQDVVLKRKEKRTAEATFELEVVTDADNKKLKRPAGILAQFSCNRRPSGFVSRAWDWTRGTLEAPEMPGHAAAASSLPIHVDAIAPDVTVKITAPIADGQHYDCSVETPLLPDYQQPVTAKFGLPESAAEFVGKKLDGLIDGLLTPAARRRNLKEVGYRFWTAAPPVFQKLIWDLIDADVTVKNLYIATAEPALPWELMIPHRVVGGVLEERPPLGVEFAIGRWTRSDSTSPPQRLPVRTAFVIAPEYEGDRRLNSAPAEVEFMTSQLRGTRVEDASIDGLDAYFKDNSASLVHFVGHGGSDEDDFDAVLLLDHEQELRSDTIMALDGFKALCRRTAPMVFLNACQTGMSIPALVGGAGFPVAFSNIGARAILAPLWPVDDELAHRFAVEVYQAALKDLNDPGTPDTPIAEIVRQVRQQAYDNEDADTYAAYAFFGDPNAVLELVDD